MSKLEYFKAKVEATLSPMDCMMATKAEPDKYMILDVRNIPPQGIKDKIAGARHIPLAQLAGRLDELPKDKVIIVYCWETWCNQGAKAAVMLLQKGWDVLEIAGGIGGWKTMGFPLEEDDLEKTIVR